MRKMKISLCNQRNLGNLCHLRSRTLLHQLMTGEVRTADLRGLEDFADEKSAQSA
jgi:hypothetical protein